MNSIIKKFLYIRNSTKINYYIMCAITLLQGFVFYGPVATIYRESRGLSINQILFLEAILLLISLIFEVPWGWFADRYGYKKTILISTFLLFMSKVIFYNSYSFNMFLFHSVLSGLSMAGISGCNLALIYESVHQKESERAFGVYQAFGTLGFFIASVFSSLLSSIALDYTVLMTIFPYGISFFLCFYLHDVDNVQINNKNLDGICIEKSFTKEIKFTFNNLIKDISNIKSIIFFIIVITLLCEVCHTIEVFLSQLQYIRSNINLKFFGIITAIGQLFCMLSSKTYLITNKFGQIKSIILFCSIILINNIILIFNTNWFISITCILLIQVSLAMIYPIIMDIENKSIAQSSKNRATILSMYSMVSSIIAAAINIIIGSFSIEKVQSSFTVCLIISLISFIGIIIYVFKFKIDKSENHNLILGLDRDCIK